MLEPIGHKADWLAFADALSDEYQPGMEEVRSGKIIMAECFQCLDCQVEYYDDKRCPPLVQAAKRRGDDTRVGEAIPAVAMVKKA